MANKTRRRRVRRAEEGEPGSRVQQQETNAAKLAKADTMKRRKANIKKHKDRAYGAIHEASDRLDEGEFAEAGKLLHEAAQFANLANAEVQKR